MQHSFLNHLFFHDFIEEKYISIKSAGCPISKINILVRDRQWRVFSVHCSNNNLENRSLVYSPYKIKSVVFLVAIQRVTSGKTDTNRQTQKTGYPYILVIKILLSCIYTKGSQ